MRAAPFLLLLGFLVVPAVAAADPWPSISPEGVDGPPLAALGLGGTF